MFKNYKIGFDIWGLIIFLIIMIPNFIWFAVPAPIDILKADSVTEIVDTIASVCQVMMIIALCLLINKERKKISITKLITASICFCLIYFASWVFYYLGITNSMVILGLTIPPCLSFLFFAIDRKNIFAVIFISIFTICHLVYGTVNFIL